MKNQFIKSDRGNIFPNADGIYQRYKSLRDNDPYKDKRAKYLSNYERKSWKRGGKGPSRDKIDPNFGQFRFKIDSAIGTFTQVLSERAMTVKVIPKYCEKGKVKEYSDAISSAFHRLFIKPWEDRFLIEAHCAFDMVMYAKAIEHWPTPGGVYSESVPVEDVFPDSNAGFDVKKWDYVFIKKRYTITMLEEMLEESIEHSKEAPDDDYDKSIIFNRSYLEKILEDPAMFSDETSDEKNDTRNRGAIKSSNRDTVIPIIFAYVKERLGDDMPVSLYCFPGEVQLTEDGKPFKSKEESVFDVRFLYEKKNYCKCISNHIANRTYLISRAWWSCNSFAEQIFLSTVLYDKSMSLVVRAAKRNSILYFKSDSANTVQKMLSQNDEEVQHVAADVSYIQTGQNNNMREIVETTRQIMMDTENGQSLAQSPGSQNVKGYAITAQEAQLRSQSQGEAETLNIKMLMNIDVFLWKEMYRRAIDLGIDEKFTKSLKAFKKEMQSLNIDPEFYDFENVYFAPSYLNGGNQSSRISNATGVAGALAIDPKNPGQEQAQRDLIGAYVGTDNVDSYVSERMKVTPSILKAGGENEDLDNAYVNPRNVPVLPDDLHLQEIPIHLMDYEMKLTAAEGLMQAADQTNNPVKKMIFLNIAQELIKAQDNKGAHINAHLQQVENSPLNQRALSEILPRYKAAQEKQDAMSSGIDKVIKALDEAMANSSLNDEKVRHTQAMNQLTENHAKTMNEVGLEKSLQQRQAGLDRSQDNRDASIAKAGIEIAEKKQKLDINQVAQENATEHKAKQAAIQTDAKEKQASQRQSPADVSERL